MRQFAGLGLIVVGGALAVVMLMRGIGRFLVFLVVDQPQIGGGFLLSTLITTLLGLYIAWQLGKKGLQLSRSVSSDSPDQSTGQSPPVNESHDRD